MRLTSDGDTIPATPVRFYAAPMPAKTKARFIAPMLLLKTDALPGDASRWAYQLKVDGYRAIAFKTGGKLYVRSRNDKDFAGRYPRVLTGLPKLTEPARYLGDLDAPLTALIASVKAQGFEGLVAKRRDSRYEAGLRSGAWQKMRVNRGQEFVIGGYTVGGQTFDALIFGYYDDDGRRIYVARTLVRPFEFLEWTGKNHLRPSRFIALRDDKRASE